MLDVIYRRGCLVASLHAIIGYPTDLPRLSVVVNNNLVPANLYFRLDVTQSDNLIEDVDSGQYVYSKALRANNIRRPLR